METKELADELMIWLPKLSAGKTLVYGQHDKSHIFAIINSITDLTEAVNKGKYIAEYIPKFPEPPEGESWFNGSDLSADQVGVNDGFRLLLISELYNRECQIEAEGWSDVERKWTKGRFWAVEKSIVTYRVKTAEHPVGSLKPKEEAVKCKEWWLSKIEYKDSWARRYQFAYLKNDKADGLGETIRVIEPLPYDVAANAMTGSESYNSKTGCIFVPNALHTLKELGMTADESPKPTQQHEPDNAQRKKMHTDIVNGFQAMSHGYESSCALATAVMDGRVSEYIRVG